MERSDSLILAAVIADLRRRELKGLETYGTTMDRTDLSHEEWLNHLYEEVLDSAVYLKKIINGTQGCTDTEKANQGNVEQTPASGKAVNIGAALRNISKGESDGSGEGGDDLEDEEEYSESEDRLLTCSTEIEAAVNALYTIEGKDKMLLSPPEVRMINEIEAMSMHITYRALAEIYQTVFDLQ